MSSDITPQFIAESLSHGKEKRLGPDSYKSLCPAHNDSEPSMVVSLGTGNKILVRCHAGCEGEKVISALKDRGLWPVKKAIQKPTHFYPVPTEHQNPQPFRHHQLGMPTGMWRYVDEKGELQGFTCRYDKPGGGKTLLPYTFVINDKGATFWASKGFKHPRPLYNAHMLAGRPADPVVMFEGEKKADAWNKLYGKHYIGMSFQGGAMGIGSANLEVLRGRHVVLWRDNDAPGTKSMNEAGALLTESTTPIAASVKIVQLPVGLPDGWDVADEIPSNMSMDLFAMVLNAPTFINPVEDVIANLNRDYAVLYIGGKTMIMKFEQDLFGKETYSLTNEDSFVRLERNQEKIKKGRSEENAPRYWLDHTQRRTYHGVKLDPARDRDILDKGKVFYNLWRGYSYEPLEGSFSIFDEHIRKNLAGGNENYYNWIMSWFAHVIKYPSGRPSRNNPDVRVRLGTSLAVRGKQGTGKTIVGHIVSKLIQHHSFQTADARYLFGQFNYHLQGVVLLQGDEAIFSGDPKIRGKLNDLITGDVLSIEPKGLNTYEFPNLLHLYLTSNEDWIIRASAEERRYAVFEIADNNIQDNDDEGFFAEMMNEMEGGGYEALLYHFLNFDFSKANPNRIPSTAALTMQKQKSLGDVESFIFNLLMYGNYQAVKLNGGGEIYTYEMMYRAYTEHAKLLNHRYPDTMHDFCTKVKSILRDSTSPKITGGGQAWKFEPIERCREMFDRTSGGPYDWVKVGTPDPRTMKPGDDEIPF